MSSIFGIGQILFSSLCLSSMSFIIKDLENVSSLNLLLYRSIIQIIVCLILSVVTRVNLVGDKSAQKLLHLRGLSGGCAVLLYFMTLKQIPVSTATALFMTTPLYTIFLARWYLKEKINSLKIFAVVVVFFGCIIVAHPTSWARNYSDLLGSSLAMTEAALAAISVTIIKLIGNKAHYIQLVFYLSVYMFAIAIVLNAYYGFTFQPFNFQILCIGVLASIGQLFVNSGLQKVTAVVGMTVRCSEVLFAFIIGGILKEPISLLSIVGAFFIVAGSYLTAKSPQSIDELYKEYDSDNEEYEPLKVNA